MNTYLFYFYRGNVMLVCVFELSEIHCSLKRNKVNVIDTTSNGMEWHHQTKLHVRSA